MKNTWFFLFVISLFFSCQPDVGTGTVIIYGDVIGSYEGQCSDYNTSTMELMNEEDATLSLSAVNADIANVKVSCSRFADQELTLKSSSASEFTFERIISASSVVSLRYIAANDSLVLIQSGSGDNDLIFAGVRK